MSFLPCSIYHLPNPFLSSCLLYNLLLMQIASLISSSRVSSLSTWANSFLMQSFRPLQNQSICKLLFQLVCAIYLWNLVVYLATKSFCCSVSSIHTITALDLTILVGLHLEFTRNDTTVTTTTIAINQASIQHL